MLIPLTCILLNEYVGEKLVNMLISALYSGILVIGASLYSISLVAMIVPLSLFIGCLVIYYAIIRPAKKAHARRLKKTKVKFMSTQSDVVFTTYRPVSSAFTSTYGSMGGHAERSSRRTEGISHYFMRVYKLVKHRVQFSFTSLSKEFYRTKLRRKRTDQGMWCAMNRPSNCQAFVPSTITTIETLPLLPPLPPLLPPLPPLLPPLRTRKDVRKNPPQCNSLVEVGPPIAIKNIMTHSKVLTVLQSTAVTSYRRSGRFNIGSTGIIGILKTKDKDKNRNMDAEDDDDSESSSVGHLVLMTADQSTSRRRKNQSSIFLEPAEAIGRMKAHLRGSAPQYSKQSLHVIIRDLELEFRTILDILYLDGIEMSEAEKIETLEQFDDWTIKQVSHSVEEDCDHIIPFSSFEEWVTRAIFNTLHSIVKERLLNRTLSYSPRGNKNKRASAPAPAPSSRQVSGRNQGTSPLPPPPALAPAPEVHTEGSLACPTDPTDATKCKI